MTFIILLPQGNEKKMIWVYPNDSPMESLWKVHVKKTLIEEEFKRLNKAKKRIDETW